METITPLTRAEILDQVDDLQVQLADLATGYRQLSQNPDIAWYFRIAGGALENLWQELNFATNHGLCPGSDE